MTITIKKLTIEERKIWGKCPVCDSPHGKSCKPTSADIEPGVHVARLVNAPVIAAIREGE